MNDFQKIVALFSGLILLFAFGYLVGHLLRLGEFYKYKKTDNK